MRWAQWPSRNQFIAILYDIFTIPLAWFGAFWLRFNLDGIPEEALHTALLYFPVVLLIQMTGYGFIGLYRGIWQFASLQDLLRILKAALIGVFGSLFALFLLTRLQVFPRSVLPIYTMLLVLGLGGARFAVRWLKEKNLGRHAGQRVLIVGAGTAGEGLVRELLRDGTRHYTPIAFVDDHRNKLGQDIHGIRVIGRCNEIPSIVAQEEIDLIVIAIPRAGAKEMRRIMGYCEVTTCRVRTLPSTQDLVSGRVSIELLREVSLEDLLGRDPVTLDWKSIEGAIHQQVVLVTGGGGSIGSELSRQIAALNPKQLIVVERSEFNLFSLEQEFQDSFPQVHLVSHLLDVNDRIAIHDILKRYHPTIIFHAAAYKHVPMLESQPREAIANNVMGTRTMAELAVACGVKKFVLVSTDKAVNPSNVMGATKRCSEMICHHYNEKKVTQFIIVRFGNVLGSAGSVVPIFKHQIERGGPVTVTHPDITRFFMTIPEACQLILQALGLGKGGEIFVLDMGEPIKIQYLAEQMIRLAGKRIGEDIEIEYRGLRAGEKLFEELFHPEEMLEPTLHQKIFQAKAGSLQSLKHPNFQEILAAFDQAVMMHDEAKLLQLLKHLVPGLSNPTASVLS